MNNLSDVVLITGWDSESKLLKSKNSDLPAGMKKFYQEDFEDFIKKENITLSNSTIIKEGLILVKNPFEEKSYLNFDEAELQIVHSKAQYISEILQNLGAKSYTTHSYKTFESKKERTLNIEASVEADSKSGKGNLKSGRTQYQKDVLDYNREDSFSGELTKETYAKAMMLAEKYGLNNDLDVAGLLKQRNPENSNLITSRKISIDMTREFNKTRDIVFGLKTSKLDLNASYTSILESKHHITFEFDIKF